MNREYYRELWKKPYYYDKSNFWIDLEKEKITEELLQWLEEILPQNPEDKSISRFIRDERLLKLLARKGFRPLWIDLLCSTDEEFDFLHPIFNITGEEICRSFSHSQWVCHFKGEMEKYFTPIFPLPLMGCYPCLFFGRTDVLDRWNGKHYEWNSLITHCALRGNIHMLRYLLSRYSIPKERWSNTLFYTNIGNREILRVFLQEWGKEAWKEGLRFVEKKELLSVFLEEGFSPYLYLPHAVRSDNVPAVEYLLSQLPTAEGKIICPPGQIEQMWLHVETEKMTKYLSRRYPCPSPDVLRGLLLKAVNQGKDGWGRALLKAGALPGKKIFKACSSILTWMRLLGKTTGKKFLRKLNAQSS